MPPAGPWSEAALEALEVINHSVAEGLEADPAGFVDIGPGRAFSVVEIGSPAMHLEGERVRCISADNSVLQSLPVVALKSALAVEYGHLSDLDPAGGGFCRNMRRANEASLLAMVRSGLDRPTNLRWMALRFRAWSFGLMSSGGESLQCHLSDRWTVERFGAEAFEVAQAAMGADRKDVADRLASVRAYACPDPPRADRGAWGLMADLLKGVG